MKDFQIREVLRRTELAPFFADGESKVVEELDIHVAGARIDIAVINGALHGYEIKGGSDTLKRLPNQIIAYSFIFDNLTVITEEKHVHKIVNLSPEWVSVAICSELHGLTFVKKGTVNPNKNGFHVAQLLWREELIEVLASECIRFKKKDRNWILCEILSANVKIDRLSEIVRRKLKSRQNWRVTKEYDV